MIHRTFIARISGYLKSVGRQIKGRQILSSQNLYKGFYQIWKNVLSFFPHCFQQKMLSREQKHTFLHTMVDCRFLQHLQPKMYKCYLNNRHATSITISSSSKSTLSTAGQVCSVSPDKFQLRSYLAIEKQVSRLLLSGVKLIIGAMN